FPDPWPFWSAGARSAPRASGPRRPPADGRRRRAYSTGKLIRRFTRHSVMLPEPSVTTLVSLIQAPLMFFTVSAHFASPRRTASSTLVGEDALISMAFAIDMVVSLQRPPAWRPVGDAGPGPVKAVPSRVSIAASPRWTRRA